MEAPPQTPVVLDLDPADYVLTLADCDASEHPSGGFSGEIAARSDQRVVLRFVADAALPQAPGTTSGEHPRWGELRVLTSDEGLAFSDAAFLLSVLLLTEHHQDTLLHRAHRWGYIDARTERRHELPHPPRIETCQALLGSLPVPTRIRLLIEACEIALPVWTAWAKAGELGYFDGIMSMAVVPHNLAEATLASVRAWLEDGDPDPLERWSGEYRRLHWPMLEDEWEVPPNVYYSLFAPRNLAECALDGGSLTAALVCIQQATAARCTNAQDTFLGEPFRKAFFLAWWRACSRVLCAS